MMYQRGCWKDCICGLGTLTPPFQGGPSLLHSSISCIIKTLWRKLARKQNITVDVRRDLQSEERDQQDTRRENANNYQVPEFSRVIDAPGLATYHEEDHPMPLEVSGVIGDHGQLLSLADHVPHHCLVVSDGNRQLIEINLETGAVTIDDSLQVDEAAVLFWDHLRGVAEEGTSKTATVIQNLTRKVKELETENLSLRMLRDVNEQEDPTIDRGYLIDLE